MSFKLSISRKLIIHFEFQLMHIYIFFPTKHLTLTQNRSFVIAAFGILC